MFEFKRLARHHLSTVMVWRSSAHVTKFMNTDIIPDYGAQVHWFEHLNPNYNWVIYVEGTPVGLISLHDAAFYHGRTSFGFYIGDRDYWVCGPFVLPYFYNYVFDTYPIKKIMAEVFSANERVIKIHSRHGFRTVGTLKDHIYKYDTYHDMTMMELSRESWDNLERYQGLFAKFE